MILTRKGVVNETPVRRSSRTGKSFVWIHVNQLRTYSAFQPTPTSLHTLYESDQDLQLFKQH